MPPRLMPSVFKADIFKGKVLFCTGGGSGIGRAITEAMMRHGADAVIVGRKLDRLTQTAQELSTATGQTCIPARADVRSPEMLRDAVKCAIEKFERIDYVVCGAAGNFLASIDGMSENAFKTVIDIDTLGTFNTVKATLLHIRASKGSYVHISATLHYRGTPHQVHASAAKAAVDALSRVLAVEEGPRGVRSNVIAPGPIGDTPGFSRLSPTLDEKETAEAQGRTFPLGRPGTVVDVANAAVFLFSDAAAYVTGQVIVVDGANEFVREPWLPYPLAVVDPAAVMHLIPKL